MSIAGLIEDVHVLGSADGRTCQAQLPDGRLKLVFRAFDGARGDLCVVGPRTCARFKESSGMSRALVVRFKPGWAMSLFGVAASALTDRVVSLEELWGPQGDDLHHALLGTSHEARMLEHISSAIRLRGEHHVESSSAQLARRAARLLEHGDMRVERVAERLGVTGRHLRRAFLESIGVGPKAYARSARLQRAMRMTDSTRDWSAIAAEAGYYDQAHLIADFRALTGFTPRGFLERSASLGA